MKIAIHLRWRKLLFSGPGLHLLGKGFLGKIIVSSKPPEFTSFIFLKILQKLYHMQDVRIGAFFRPFRGGDPGIADKKMEFFRFSGIMIGSRLEESSLPL